MLLLSPDQTATLRSWFLPDRPGPLVGLHVISTGHGACFVDRWPAPRAALIVTADNGALVGQPDAQFLHGLRAQMAHFVDAPEDWDAALRAAFPDLTAWDRVIFALTRPPTSSDLPGADVRRLSAADAYAVWSLGPESSWISKTWGGPPGLAASAMAWGAFVETRLVAVACSFFVGQGYEEVGVVTEPGFRGRGLSAACAAGLCREIQTRGRVPSWTTSPDNRASLRVAEKLGFGPVRNDRLYVIGMSVPAPAQPDETTG